mmetsp:Transcript_149888/g.265068  ORF Transcript_149888/g.265068 Transcript_149888/m.265068 type:complete len:222 (+) Transcript_149888:35-700(+)
MTDYDPHRNCCVDFLLTARTLLVAEVTDLLQSPHTFLDFTVYSHCFQEFACRGHYSTSFPIRLQQRWKSSLELFGHTRQIISERQQIFREKLLLLLGCDQILQLLCNFCLDLLDLSLGHHVAPLLLKLLALLPLRLLLLSQLLFQLPDCTRVCCGSLFPPSAHFALRSTEVILCGLITILQAHLTFFQMLGTLVTMQNLLLQFFYLLCALFMLRRQVAELL